MRAIAKIIREIVPGVTLHRTGYGHGYRFHCGAPETVSALRWALPACDVESSNGTVWVFVPAP